MKKRITLECLCNRYTDIKTPCCDDLIEMLNKCQMRMGYLKAYNRYGIMSQFTPRIEEFDFCPWCGKKLPDPIEEKNES